MGTSRTMNVDEKTRRTARLDREQGGCCYYCKYPLRFLPKYGKPDEGICEGDNWRSWRAARTATLDHIVPRSQGGRNELENLVLACHWCNGFRADRPAFKALYWIRRLVSAGHHPHYRAERTGRFGKNVDMKLLKATPIDEWFRL